MLFANILNVTGRKYLSAIVLTLNIVGVGAHGGWADAAEPQFTSQFRIQECEFEKRGRNPYFILEPGHQLILESEDELLISTVLRRSEKIHLPGIGTIETAVLREQHYEDDRLVEESVNFFAICDETNDVYYFGEEVDIFNPDGSITHEGAWRAGQDGALPGIIMPGTFLLGARYFQEVAPGIALDRAEHVEMGFALETEAAIFQDCVRIVESSPLDPGINSDKTYCAGVGLVIDDELQLTEFTPAKRSRGD